MSLKFIADGDPAEDGHPCQAALMFRDVVIKSGIAGEVSADALDLAIAFAWIGKAVSRTTVASEWMIEGMDPNTWQVVPLLASDGDVRSEALKVALTGNPGKGFERELSRLRSTAGFVASVATMKSLASMRPDLKNVLRLSELAGLANGIPARQRTLPRAKRSGNVVILESFRRRQAAS
jgi:hypothetical protein